MGSETRAVAERLRDGLAERGMIPVGLGVMIAIEAGAPRGIVSGVGEPRRFPVAWYDDPTGSLPPVTATFWAAVLPDLDAPATWGVLLGLLAAEGGEWQVESCGTEGVSVLRSPDGDWRDETVQQHVGLPGDALALAVLAALGER